ncbi:MAG: hypothetical protein QM639_07930 [Rhodocyclaceae bacterium]
MRTALLLSLTLISCAARAELKTLLVPTAADGEVSVVVDTERRLPVGASDERATVTDASLTFPPKNPGDPLQITWRYSIHFSSDVKVSAVLIENERDKELETVVQDANPQLINSTWVGQEAPKELTKEMFAAMNSNDVWMLLRRITVEYEDGKSSKLHQLIIESPVQRRNLLNKLWNQLQPQAK